jgi:hypothetical protein
MNVDEFFDHAITYHNTEAHRSTIERLPITNKDGFIIHQFRWHFVGFTILETVKLLAFKED